MSKVSKAGDHKRTKSSFSPYSNHSFGSCLRHLDPGSIHPCLNPHPHPQYLGWALLAVARGDWASRVPRSPRENCLSGPDLEAGMEDMRPNMEKPSLDDEFGWFWEVLCELIQVLFPYSAWVNWSVTDDVHWLTEMLKNFVDHPSLPLGGNIIPVVP